MDQTDQHHNLQSLTQFISSQLSKKITHLLLSLSVFSFFLSYSSWYTFFLHSFNFRFSTFPFQLLTHTMDKNCIFLICNGIVMLLAKTSGLIHSSPASNHLNNQLLKKIGDGDVLQLSLETKDSLLEKQVSVETLQQQEDSKEGESEEDLNLNVEGEEQEARNGFLITVCGEDEENEKDLSTINNGFAIEEEEEDGLLSREELNKKCDDFIRRMKEEIRIGAQQQLVVA